MADIITLTKDAALAILNQSVVSGSINEAGHLILTRKDGTTIDGGDFNAIVSSIQQQVVSDAVKTEVFNKVSGTLLNKGNVTGAVEFDAGTAPADATTLVNALITMTLTGNITIDAANAFPSGCKPGTQFAVKMTQDATGGRTLTLTGIKRSQGVLTLSTAANAIDIVIFMYDGTNWYAGMMGMDFK